MTHYMLYNMYIKCMEHVYQKIVNIYIYIIDSIIYIGKKKKDDRHDIGDKTTPCHFCWEY